MKKYDKYKNELTSYINVLVGFDISDLVGDIAGDILDLDIPVNIPNGSTTIDVLTSLGPMKIKYDKGYYQETLILTRRIDDTIYEEFIIDLNELIIENKVSGLRLENRENGIILTEINREYERIKQNEEPLRMVRSREIRVVYNRQQLYGIGLYLWLFDLDKQLELIKEDYKKFTSKRITPLVESRINMEIPRHIIKLHQEDGFSLRFNFDINSHTFYHLYSGINDEKLLEIVDDLFHANISSISIEHLKKMIRWAITPEDYRENNINGFNLFDYYGHFWSNNNENFGTINSLTEDYIGPSITKMKSEYYAYLRDLVLSAFDLDFSPSTLENEDIIKLLKENYK